MVISQKARYVLNIVIIHCNDNDIFIIFMVIQYDLKQIRAPEPIELLRTALMFQSPPGFQQTTYP